MLGTAKGAAWSTPLICKSTNPEPYLLYLAHTPQEAIFLCLQHPWARYQATRGHPYSSESTQINQTHQSSTFILPYLAFSEMTIYWMK